MSANTRPWVQAACVCEKVLVEQDRVASLIRIFDTYTVDVPDGPSEDWAIQPLTVFVALRSEDMVGEFEVGLRLVSPDGKVSPVRKWTVELRGGEQGANLKIEVNLQAPKLGLHWFDVLWGREDDVLTRIAFRLKSRTDQVPKGAEAEPTATT